MFHVEHKREEIHFQRRISWKKY